MAGWIALLCSLIALALFVLVHNIASRQSIEAVASDAIGMNVAVSGPIHVSLLPEVGLVLHEVSIRNMGKDLASAKEVRVGFAVIPLLKRQVRITELGISEPKFLLERDSEGRFNFERAKPGQKKRAFEGVITVKNFSLSHGGIVYRDLMLHREDAAEDIDLNLKDVSIDRDGEPGILKGVSFSGDLVAAGVKINQYRLSNVRAAVRAGKGVIDAGPIVFAFFNGEGRGSARLVETGEAHILTADAGLSHFRIEEVVSAFSKKKILSGRMDFTAHLTLKGSTFEELERSISGDVSLKGANLTLHNFDPDSVVSKYERSQRFNLVGVAGALLLGPLGAVLAKGYDFAAAYMEPTDRAARIEKIVSVWKVKNRVAEAEDVALTTKKNRVALKGRLDFINDRFDDVTVAAVDEKGCVKMREKLDGPFRHPRIEKAGPLRSLFGPVISAFEKVGKALKGGRCEVFYAGSLKHPK